MSALAANGAEVGGSACGFPAAGHKERVKAVEGWVVAEGYRKRITPGSGDTVSPYIYGQYTGGSGGVGVPTADFWRLWRETGYEGGGRLWVP